MKCYLSESWFTYFVIYINYTMQQYILSEGGFTTSLTVIYQSGDHDELWGCVYDSGFWRIMPYIKKSYIHYLRKHVFL